MAAGDFAVEEAAIRTYFKTQWDGLYPDTLLFAGNDRVGTPEITDVSVPGDELKHCWAQINFLWGDSQQADLYGIQPMFRSVGAVVVQIFTPAGRGLGTVMGIADDVVSIFRRLRVGGTLFRAPFPTRVGLDEAGWYQINVNAPMQFDATP